MEVGSDFNGSDNMIAYDSEATWFYHGCGGENFQSISLYSSQVSSQDKWHKKDIHERDIQIEWVT